MTYMNDSGQSGRRRCALLQDAPDDIVVMHDEIDLAAAKLKVKKGGGDAGHNGLRSITAAIGPDYRRVRIGVGHPGEKGRVHSHVLDNFSNAEEDEWLVPMLSGDREAAPLLARRRRCRLHEQGGAGAQSAGEKAEAGEGCTSDRIGTRRRGDAGYGFLREPRGSA